MRLKVTAILFLLGLLVLFTIQNVEVIEISFLVWDIEIARSLLLFLVFSSGVLTGWLINALAGISKKHRTETP